MVRDMTAGSPSKILVTFALPMILGNVFQQLYNIVDSVVVGNFVGSDALAAVGASYPVTFLFIAVATGASIGCSVVISQFYGAKRITEMKSSVFTALTSMMTLSALLLLAGLLLARPLLLLMRTPGDIFSDADAYLRIYVAAVPFLFLYNTSTAAFNALGDSRTPLLFLAAACVLNIGLDFVLILWCSMGVAGAAVATVFSQLVSGGLCLLYMFRRFPVLRLQRRDWIPERRMLLNESRVGLPMGFQMSIIAIGAMILQIALNRLGSTAIAGFIAAQKIDQLANQPMMSFGITMATYAAQNYGAGNMRRIRAGVRRCILMSVGFSIVCGGALILAAKPMAGLFVGADQPEVLDYVQTYLLLNASLYFLLALLFIFRYTLQGLGKSLFPTIAGVAELLMRTLAALVLANIWGYAGVCLSNPIAWFGALIPLTTAYVLTIRRLPDTEGLAAPAVPEAEPAAD